jgi:hypothetical protein
MPSIAEFIRQYRKELIKAKTKLLKLDRSNLKAKEQLANETLWIVFQIDEMKKYVVDDDKRQLESIAADANGILKSLGMKADGGDLLYLEGEAPAQGYFEVLKKDPEFLKIDREFKILRNAFNKADKGNAFAMLQLRGKIRSLIERAEKYAQDRFSMVPETLEQFYEHYMVPYYILDTDFRSDAATNINVIEGGLEGWHRRR